MKKLSIIAVAALAFSLKLAAQQKPKIDFPDYQFTTELELPITPIRNQYRSGTCWAFSPLAFVESEVIRINNIKDTLQYPYFSPMFVVKKSYSERA